MFNKKIEVMKKFIQTIAAAIVVFFAVASVSAQDDLTYIDESPVDSSHMEQTINLGEEEVEVESSQSWILYAGIAVILIAGVVIVMKKKKK